MSRVELRVCVHRANTMIRTRHLAAAMIGAALLRLSAPALACTGDCHADGAVSVDELLVMVNIALNNLPISACAAGDADGNGQITVDEILSAVGNALTACPTSRVVGFGLIFGGGPGGTTFLPLTLSADNIVAVTLDLCFVDSVFTFSDAQTFVSQGVSVKSFAVSEDACALNDLRFPRGHTLRAELTGDGDQPIPSGQFVTLAFDSSSEVAPACYPAQLRATLRAGDGQTVVSAVSGMMKVFIFQGSRCEMDCPCEPGFCRDGVCCEEACQGGTCNVPGSEGLCVRG